MSQLLVTGAVLHKITRTAKHGLCLEIHADWTDDLLKQLNVETPSGRYGKSVLTPKFNGVNFILTPIDDALKAYEIDITCSTVGQFRYVPCLAKDGTVKSREIHFQVSSGMTDGASKTEFYQGKVGDAPGSMKIIYNEQEQLEFDGDAESAEAPKKRGRRKEVTPINETAATETVQ